MRWNDGILIIILPAFSSCSFAGRISEKNEAATIIPAELPRAIQTNYNIPEGLAVGVAFAGCRDGNYLPALILAIGIGIQNFRE